MAKQFQSVRARADTFTISKYKLQLFFLLLLLQLFSLFRVRGRAKDMAAIKIVHSNILLHSLLQQQTILNENDIITHSAEIVGI